MKNLNLNLMMPILQELKNKINYFENETIELKSIIEDLTQEKKKLSEEKNEMIRKQREKINELNEQNNIFQIFFFIFS